MRTYDTQIGKLPSVTTILDSIGKPQLLPWAAGLQHTIDVEHAWKAHEGLMQFENKDHFITYMGAVKGKYREASTTAMDLGSWVHNAIQAWCENLFDGDYMDYLNFLSDFFPKQAIQMLGGWFNCIHHNNIKILKSEMTVYHPDGFAGTLDAIVQFDDAIMVADWKTGGVYWPYWLQTEAYRRAYTWMFKEEPVGRMILRLDKETPGDWELLVRPIEIDTQIRVWQDKRKKKPEYRREIQHFTSDHNTDYKAFLAAKTIFERGKQK